MGRFSLLGKLVASFWLISSFVSPVYADGSISGQVWNDINLNQNKDFGTNVLTPFGDPLLPDSGIEMGVENIAVKLLDSGGSELASTTSTADGSYSFPTQADGAYILLFEAPDRFDFSATTPAGEHSATSDPAPAPGNPQTARISLNIAGSDVSTGTDVGLRALTEFTIDVADLNPDPNVMQAAIESGKPDFDPFNDCAYDGTDSEEATDFKANPPTAGSDCYHFDNWIRSNDLETYTFSITATNHPDLNGNGLLDTEDEIQNAILEILLKPIDNGDGDPELKFEVNDITGVPNGCLGSSDGVTPVSSITNDGAGNTVLLCNLGNMDNSARIMPISVKATGNSPHGSSFNIEARVLSAINDGQASDVFTGMETFVSAAPRFDLVKGPHSVYDAVTNPIPNPYNKITQYAAFVTKDIGNGPELGKAIQWDFSIIAGTGDNRGLAALGDTITFYDVYADYPTYKLHGCSDTPYNGGSKSTLPLDGSGGVFRDDRTANNGAWTCTQANPGDPIQVTITNADTSGEHIPTKGSRGNDVSSVPIVVTGSVTVWVPLADFYRSVNPAWQDTDEPEYGTYPVTNCSSDFDPDSLHAPGNTSLGNYGDGFEPSYGEIDGDPVATGNNCHATTVTITPTGSFAKYVGDGARALTRGGPVHPCPSYIIEGQTACGSGDGPVTAGQLWHSTLGWYNQGKAGSVPGLALCDVIDNALYKPVPFADTPGNNPEPDEPAFAIPWQPGTPAMVEEDFLIEYAYFNPSLNRKTWWNDHAADVANPITGYLPVTVHDDMKNAALDCGEALTNAGTLLWTDEPATIPGGFNDIVIIKATVDNAANEVSPNANIYFGGLFEVRETIYGDSNQPGTGIPVKSGMLNFNIANYYRTDTGYGAGDYNPDINRGDVHTSHTYGARLIYQTVDIRITKGADTNAADAQAQADAMQQGFAGKEKIYWWLDPTVSDQTNAGIARNMVVQDTLPPYVTYNPGCTPELPAGVTGPVISAGANQGETVLTWNLGDRPANVDIEPIVICTDTSAFAPAPVDVINRVIVSADNVATPEDPRTASRTVRLLQLGQLAVHKAVDQSIDPRNDEQIWTLTWANTSENLPFEPEDVIDVFPWNGDSLQAGNANSTREGFASDYTGTLQLTAALPAPTKTLVDASTRPANGVWYYTSDAVNTVNHNPKAASNDLASGSTNWCTEAEFNTANCPANFREVVAVRWKAESDSGLATFDPLMAGESVSVDLPLAAGTFGNDASQVENQANDFYVNRFGAYSGTVDDPVFSNEPYVLVVGFSLGDLLFFDIDKDGKYDSSIDLTAPEGVVIELLDSSDTVIQNTTTLDNGRYLFEKVPPGDYYVRIPAAEFNDKLADWRPAGDAVADPNADDANEDIDHHTVTDSAVSGAARSSGLITLSATHNAGTGTIDGDEPIDDNVAALGKPLIPDNMTNFTLDLGLISDVDLELMKAVDKTEVFPGEIINYTLTLRNTGKADALGVVVNDALPTKLEYQSDDSNGKYDPISGNWDVGRIAGGETLTLTISVKVL